MKKLIQKIIIFLFPIVLVFIFIEVFYRMVPNDFTVKNNVIAKKYKNTEILIFGNSHTFYGLNPVFFNKPAFNLSNISQTLYFDQLLFEKHIDQFKKLKFVILNIEYTSLSQLQNTDEDIWRKHYYENYMNLEIPIISRFEVQNYFISSTRSFHANVNLVFRYVFHGTIVDCDENGFGINYKKPTRITNLSEAAVITAKRHEDNLSDFGENVSRLQSIIDKCKKKGINVVLVTMPVSKDYANRIDKIKLHKIFRTVNTIEKQNSNVCYLNLFSDSRFVNSDFYDADHLHNEGAKKCSRIVNDYLQKADIKSTKHQF